MNKSLPIIVSFVAGIILTFWIASDLISQHQVPSLQEFMAIQEATSTQYMNMASTTIRAPKGKIHGLIANDDLSREKGLSGRGSISSDTGMIFYFDEPGNYSFWMKDMLMPIDIVWIDQKKTVVGIVENISPWTFPDKFMPPKPIKYVLELNLGGAKNFGIATGTILVF